LAVDLGGRRILDDLRCTLSAGTIVCSAERVESTLNHVLLGFHKPASGTARIFGHDVRHDIRKIRNVTGYMPGTRIRRKMSRFPTCAVASFRDCRAMPRSAGA